MHLNVLVCGTFYNDEFWTAKDLYSRSRSKETLWTLLSVFEPSHSTTWHRWCRIHAVAPDIRHSQSQLAITQRRRRSMSRKFTQRSLVWCMHSMSLYWSYLNPYVNFTRRMTDMHHRLDVPFQEVSEEPNPRIFIVRSTPKLLGNSMKLSKNVANLPTSQILEIDPEGVSTVILMMPIDWRMIVHSLVKARELALWQTPTRGLGMPGIIILMESGIEHRWGNLCSIPHTVVLGFLGWGDFHIIMKSTVCPWTFSESWNLLSWTELPRTYHSPLLITGSLLRAQLLDKLTAHRIEPRNASHNFRWSSSRKVHGIALKITIAKAHLLFSAVEPPREPALGFTTRWTLTKSQFWFRMGLYFPLCQHNHVFALCRRTFEN